MSTSKRNERRAVSATSAPAGPGRGQQGGPTATELYAHRVGAGRGEQGGPTATELKHAQVRKHAPSDRTAFQVALATEAREQTRANDVVAAAVKQDLSPEATRALVESKLKGSALEAGRALTRDAGDNLEILTRLQEGRRVASALDSAAHKATSPEAAKRLTDQKLDSEEARRAHQSIDHVGSAYAQASTPGGTTTAQPGAAPVRENTGDKGLTLPAQEASPAVTQTAGATAAPMARPTVASAPEQGLSTPTAGVSPVVAQAAAGQPSASLPAPVASASDAPVANNGLAKPPASVSPAVAEAAAGSAVRAEGSRPAPISPTSAQDNGLALPAPGVSSAVAQAATGRSGLAPDVSRVDHAHAHAVPSPAQKVEAPAAPLTQPTRTPSDDGLSKPASEVNSVVAQADASRGTPAQGGSRGDTPRLADSELSKPAAGVSLAVAAAAHGKTAPALGPAVPEAPLSAGKESAPTAAMATTTGSGMPLPAPGASPAVAAPASRAARDTPASVPAEPAVLPDKATAQPAPSRETPHPVRSADVAPVRDAAPRVPSSPGDTGVSKPAGGVGPVVAEAVSATAARAASGAPSSSGVSAATLEQAIAQHMQKQGFDKASVAMAPTIAEAVRQSMAEHNGKAPAVTFHKEGASLATLTTEKPVATQRGESVISGTALARAAEKGVDTAFTQSVRSFAPEITGKLSDLQVSQGFSTGAQDRARLEGFPQALSEKLAHSIQKEYQQAGVPLDTGAAKAASLHALSDSWGKGHSEAQTLQDAARQTAETLNQLKVAQSEMHRVQSAQQSTAAQSTAAAPTMSR